MFVAKIAVLVTAFACVRGIYEKEAGHYDWQRLHVGRFVAWTQSTSMGGHIVMAGEDGAVATIDASTGAVDWRVRISDRVITSVVSLKAGVIVAGSDDGFISGIDAESGSLKWSSNLGYGGIFACDASDLFMMKSTGKIMNSTDGSEYKGSASCKIAGSTSASPLSVDGVTVSQDSALVIKGIRDGSTLWTREEALASVAEIEIVSFKKDAPVGMHELSWLIGGYKAAVCLSRTYGRLVVVDIVSAKTLGGVEIPIAVVSIKASSSPGLVDLLDSKKAVIGQLDVDSMTVNSVEADAHPTEAQYRYAVDPTTGSIGGFSGHTKVWSIELRQPVVSVIDPAHQEYGSMPVLVKGDASVVFKYMNKNLVYVLSMNGEVGITVTAVDTVTGAIPMQTVIRSALPESSKLHFLACENWVVGHYFNSEKNRFEVIAIDLYEKREDKGFYAAATGQARETTESAYELPVDIFVLSQQYVFPLGPVTAVAVTATGQGVTPRQVLFATTKGILAIRKDTWLNPRRPGGEKICQRLAMSGEENLPPYSPVLPVIFTDFLSHALSLDRVDKIVVTPTHLESTSIVVAIGPGEMFVAPAYIGNAPYDVLSPFFNYWLLYVSFGAVLLGVLVTSVLAKNKELYDKWK